LRGVASHQTLDRIKSRPTSPNDIEFRVLLSRSEWRANPI